MVVEVLGILSVIIEIWKVKEKRDQYKCSQNKFKVLASRVRNMGKQSRDEKKKKNKREILRKKKVKRANSSLNCTASSKKEKKKRPVKIRKEEEEELLRKVTENWVRENRYTGGDNS